MDFLYTGTVTGQQRQWIADAISRSTYPWEAIPATVTFDTQAEPPAPGHKDVMCTVGGDGVYTITIRAGVDLPDSRVAKTLPNPASDIRTFFAECIVHELAHVVAFEILDTDEAKTAVAALLERNGAMGDGTPAGELEDWNDPDYPWEDRVVEGVAEIIKDVALNSRYRIYDNRTNWEVPKENFAAFLTALSPPGGPFYDDFAVDRMADYTVNDIPDNAVVADGVLSSPDYYYILADEVDIQVPFRASIKVLPTHVGEADWLLVGIATAGVGWWAGARMHTGPIGGWLLELWHPGGPMADGDATEPPSPFWLTFDWDGGTEYTASLWLAEPSEEYGVGVPDRTLTLVAAAPPGPVFPTLWGDSTVDLDDWKSTSIGTGVEWVGAWPYEDPTISGGQSATGVMRFA